MIVPETNNLTETTSLELIAKIQSELITTSLSSQPIPTAYVQEGKGTPILLLHGFDSSLLEFRRLIPLLSSEYQTIAVDLLGFGFTERLPGLAYGALGIKTHLYYFWKTKIQQPVILVGTSMGGAAALDFTLSYPEAVSNLVLIDSAGLTASPMVSKFMFPPLDKVAANFLSNPRVRENISRTAYFDKTLVTEDSLTCATLHLQKPGWSQALIGFTKSGGYGNFAGQLPKIPQPTLILWGENDKILGTKDAKRFREALKNSQLFWIPQCGHVPHLEKPERVAELIKSFVKQNIV